MNRILVVVGAMALAGCGQSAAAVQPTPTPLSVLAAQYTKAADKFNKASFAIQWDADCKGNLDPCRKDWATYSQLDTTFVAELRAIKFPAAMQADQRALLDVLRRDIGISDDAAHATTVAQLQADSSLSDSLTSAIGDAVDHVRLDLGLPAAPRNTPTPSPAPSASA